MAIRFSRAQPSRWPLLLEHTFIMRVRLARLCLRIVYHLPVPALELSLGIVVYPSWRAAMLAAGYTMIHLSCHHIAIHPGVNSSHV